MSPLTKTESLRDRLVRRWRWKLCCLGVAAITYFSIYAALRMPSAHIGAAFLLTAFPAAMLQFFLIDTARYGLRRDWD